MLVYLPKPAASRTGQSVAVFSSRDAGSVRISYSASVDAVVRLRVVGSLHYGKSAEGVGEVNRRPSSLRQCDVHTHVTITTTRL